MMNREQSEVTRNASGVSPPETDELKFPLVHKDAPGLIPPLDYVESDGCWHGAGSKPKKLAKLARYLYAADWKTHEASVELTNGMWEVMVEDPNGRNRRISSVHLLATAKVIEAALHTVACLTDSADPGDELGLDAESARAARSWGIKGAKVRVQKAHKNRTHGYAEVA